MSVRAKEGEKMKRKDRRKKASYERGGEKKSRDRDLRHRKKKNGPFELSAAEGGSRERER